jgi:hypothetical protein
VADWQELGSRARKRYEDGAARLPDEPDPRQRQLTRMGNAAYAVGLAMLMRGDPEAGEWLTRAADRYRESWTDAPPGSWGRPIGAIKARLMAGDGSGAEADAHWALENGAAETESPIGRYAAALALLVLGRDAEARVQADTIRIRDDFPAEVGDALAMVAAEDVVGYVEAIEAVLESFESRDQYLEDVPVADTVIAIQALAAQRGLAAELESLLLPAAR